MLLDIIPLVDRWDESDRFVDCSTFSQRCISDVPYSTGPIEEVWQETSVSLLVVP